jgi:DNA-binding XRE family transcriptional regulator
MKKRIIVHSKPEKQRKIHPRQRVALILARQALGLTRPQLAEMVGVDRTVIFKVEVGIQDTGMGIMRRWVDALGPGATLDLFKSPPKIAVYKLTPKQAHAVKTAKALAAYRQREPAA